MNRKCLLRTQPVCLNTLSALEDLHTREVRLTLVGESLQGNFSLNHRFNTLQVFALVRIYVQVVICTSLTQKVIIIS